MTKDVYHPQDAYHHYGVEESVAKAYLTYVRDHIRLVREAGERLGVPAPRPFKSASLAVLVVS